MTAQRSRQLEGDRGAHAVAEECERMTQVRRNCGFESLYKLDHILVQFLVHSRFAAGQPDWANGSGPR